MDEGNVTLVCLSKDVFLRSPDVHKTRFTFQYMSECHIMEEGCQLGCRPSSDLALIQSNLSEI